MEECAVLFILRQSVLWERSFFPPERREKLQRLFPGRAENNLFMFVSGKRLKGLCRIVEMGIFPVQQQELWRGLLLLSENIPPDQLIPANYSLTQAYGSIVFKVCKSATDLAHSRFANSLLLVICVLVVYKACAISADLEQ